MRICQGYCFRMSICSMAGKASSYHGKREAITRVCNVSSFTAEVLEIRSEKPIVRVFVIPGNPGIASFYKDFVEYLYQLLNGKASVIAIGHVAHTSEDWEHGKLFSLQDQIKHKVSVVQEELQNCDAPVVLVGHSIGAYICLEVFKQLPQEVTFIIGLYPFLAVNRDSITQSVIKRISGSSILSKAVCFFICFIGLLPTLFLRFLVIIFLGRSWSRAAVNVACTSLLRYHVMRNVLFMAMTEFVKLSGEPDWKLMKENQDKIALLFGMDDHWGPLTLFGIVSRRAPGLTLSVDREGHPHSYCCSLSGSECIARHVAELIQTRAVNCEMDAPTLQK